MHIINWHNETRDYRDDPTEIYFDNKLSAWVAINPTRHLGQIWCDIGRKHFPKTVPLLRIAALWDEESNQYSTNTFIMSFVPEDLPKIKIESHSSYYNISYKRGGNEYSERFPRRHLVRHLLAAMGWTIFSADKEEFATATSPDGKLMIAF